MKVTTFFKITWIVSTILAVGFNLWIVGLILAEKIEDIITNLKEKYEDNKR